MLFTQDVPDLNNRRFYIEGYTDTFMKDERGAGTWTQEVMLTRGLEISDLENIKGFSTRSTKFRHSGEYTPINDTKKD